MMLDTFNIKLKAFAAQRDLLHQKVRKLSLLQAVQPALGSGHKDYVKSKGDPDIFLFKSNSRIKTLKVCIQEKLL